MSALRLTEKQAARYGLVEKPARSKFNVDLSEEGKAERTYNGRLFRSVEERRYAETLDMLMQLETHGLHSWEYEPHFALVANGHYVGEYTPDFELTWRDGRTEYVEVKGRALPDWKLRAELFWALYVGDAPNVTYTIRRNGYSRPFTPGQVPPRHADFVRRARLLAEGKTV